MAGRADGVVRRWGSRLIACVCEGGEGWRKEEEEEGGSGGEHAWLLGWMEWQEYYIMDGEGCSVTSTKHTPFGRPYAWSSPAQHPL